MVYSIFGRLTGVQHIGRFIVIRPRSSSYGRNISGGVFIV
jgi:hypothetical protein